MDALCREFPLPPAPRQPQQQQPWDRALPGSTVPGSYLSLVLRRALALAVGELLDAVVDGDAALARCQVLLGDLHPAQRAHSKALSRDTRGFSATGTATSIPHRARVVTPALAPVHVPASCHPPPPLPAQPTMRQRSWRVRYLGAGLCAVLEIISMPGQRVPAEGRGSEGKLPLNAPGVPREASGTSSWEASHGGAQHGPAGFSCSGGSTQCWSRISATPQTSQQSTRRAPPPGQ